MRLQGRQVVLGITGSIAAYKAAEIASLLRKEGAEVWPVMTPAALRFITALTIGTIARNPVAHDFWEEGQGWQPGHIELADKADLLLVAPATADSIANFACGLAPDLLAALYLATRAKVLIAPAMNGKMYEHPATQENIRILRGRGHDFVGPTCGMQACGYEGPGRLAPPAEIIERAVKLLGASKSECHEPPAECSEGKYLDGSV